MADPNVRPAAKDDDQRGPSDSPAERDLWKEAFIAWGPEAQLTALASEAAELAAAISRRALGNAGLEGVWEEVVGVRSVLRSIEPWLRDELGHAADAIEQGQKRKLERRLDLWGTTEVPGRRDDG